MKWFWPLTDPPKPSLDACAVSTKIGPHEWRVLVQFRDPKADFDAAYWIKWISKSPPLINDLVRHYVQRPDDFTFIDFRPNSKKK